MRIISRFKDYYDGVQRGDTEGFPIYKREPTPLEKYRNNSNAERKMYNSDTYDCFSKMIVGVAGHVYVGYILKASNYIQSNNKYIYDIDELIKTITNEEYFKKSPSWARRGGLSEKFLRKDHANTNVERYEKIFLEERTPIFVELHGHLIKDCHLDTVRFGKIKDPYTVYQDIDMFLGNDLAQANDPQMPVGDDIVIAESKGYNKQSFRMESPGKKRKKNK